MDLTTLGASAWFLPGLPWPLGQASGSWPPPRPQRWGSEGQWHRGALMMSIFFTASPFLTAVSGNKHAGKQRELSMFIAAIEKIM